MTIFTAGALLLMAACSPSASPTETAGESAAASVSASAPASIEPTAAASEEPQSGAVTVTIVGRAFGADITIAAGTTVTFVNQDAVGHTVTHGANGVADPNALFDESLGDGGSFTFTFDTPGTYPVTCRIHPSMNVTITVV